ncbi:MAG: homocysteine S-methyltransferase family protein [Pirellulales bacterium]
MGALFRDRLPQLDGALFLTDGGQETTFVFHDGLPLPEFAAFDLLNRDGGEEHFARYYRQYAAIASQHSAGLVLEAPTWRASADWGSRLGYTSAALEAANLRAVGLLVEIRAELQQSLGLEMTVVSGCVGPRGDGYQPGQQMSAAEAEQYHRPQVEVFARSDADMVTAMTLNYANEALGIVRAAQAAGMPVAISFTVETDGRLPTGQSLGDAIEQVDDATDAYPGYYLINCAHPTHIAPALADDRPWQDRLRGLRANASVKSHAELDEATQLDTGDPAELGWQYADFKRRLPRLNVLGGCCGTDARHVASIAAACAPLFAS